MLDGADGQAQEDVLRDVELPTYVGFVRQVKSLANANLLVKGEKPP
jgi:hypothetical protein